MSSWRINLTPDYCCGGGHCGPLPGYYFKCPLCDKDSSARTGSELRPGESLQCFLCKGKIKAITRQGEYTYDFEEVPMG